MRKSVSFAIAVLLAGLCALPARADEAQRLIDQNLKAMGGSKAITRLQTLAIDGSIQATGDQIPGTYTFKVKHPNRLYTEIRSQRQNPD